MSARKAGFTQRLALACARRPWLTIGVWAVAFVVALLVYMAWGDVFTTSSKFLGEPDSQKASELIEQHGGNGGSLVAQAGASVQKLADGLGSAREGAGSLAEGTGAVSSAAKKLERGLRKLSTGAGEVSAGTKQAGSGAESLSAGLDDAAQGASSLSSGMVRLEDAIASLSVGLDELYGGSAELSAAAGKVTDAAGDLATGASGVASGVKSASSAADQLQSAAAGLDAAVAAYLKAHPDAAGDATYQQIVALAGQLASGTSSLASGARDLRAGLARSARGTHRLARSAGTLASGSAELAGGVGSAAEGSAELASGQQQLAEGSGKVASGVGGAAAGAGKIAAATGKVKTGAADLSEGLASASSGAEKLNDSLSSVGTLNNHDSEVVVVHSDELTVDDAAFKAEVVRIRDQLAALPSSDVVSVLSRYDKHLDATTRDALTSDDGHSTIMKVELSTSSDEAMNHLDGVYDIVEKADASPRFEVAVTGSASLSRDAQELAGKDLRRGELIGVPVALAILVLVFGALVAAGLPLALGLFSIVTSLAITVVIGQAFELSIFALNILVATGLALGIDYSLFIVSRYREERRGGKDKLAAIAAASATASSAVFFSGMTVVLSLTGMLIVPLSIFTSLGIGAMAAAFTAAFAALTLLPALLSLLGDRIDALRVPWLNRRSGRVKEDGWWGKAARRSMRNPVIGLALGVVVLLAIAGPALTMRTGGYSAESFPTEYTSKQGLDMLRRDFAVGMSEPVTVVVDGDVGDAGVRKAIKGFVAALDEDGRFTVTGASTATDGSLTVLSMVQDAGAISQKAETAVLDLRDTLVPDAFAGTGAEVYVGGTTAAQIDSVDITDGYMPIVIGMVLTLSFVLLLLAFRSVIVSATAIVMNLLSVGASYGALTFVFQWGWGAQLLGLAKVESIESWVPLLMFCVLFGLSMDYQVFLLSRIRERWSETHDSREAVVFGVQSTAGIITGAALIMVAVFFGMGSGQLVILQELGLGLAIAVLLDAFVVRVVVAPAMIALIGDRYWWMPRWLEWLPRIDIEGPAPETAGREDALPGGAGADAGADARADEGGGADAGGAP